MIWKIGLLLNRIVNTGLLNVYSIGYCCEANAVLKDVIISLQYASITALIRELLDKVEEDHRAKLEQLNTIQSEQRWERAFESRNATIPKTLLVHFIWHSGHKLF